MPFKKGQSGNPRGAPRRSWTWSGVLQKVVQEKVKGGGTVKEIIAKSLIEEAKKGNIQAHKVIMDRMDGMPKQEVDINKEGQPLIVEHIYKHGSHGKNTV